MHSAVRTAVLPAIIEGIMRKYGLGENEALDLFYRSATGGSFEDDETGLYGQSVNYILSLLDEELKES